MKTFCTRILWVALLLFFCGSTLIAQPTIRTLRVPDKGLQPQVEVDAKGVVHLIYLTGDPQACDIWYAESTDDAATFSKPIRVNAHAGSALAIGTMRGPQMALGRDGIVHVAWMGSWKSIPQFNDRQPAMLYSRLGADGKFEPEKSVMIRFSGLDGGGGIAADAKGSVYVAWHAPVSAGGAEGDRRLVVAHSHDDGRTFAPEQPVGDDGLGACACCGVKLFAPAAGGRVVALYRTAKQMTHRDTRAIVFDDHLKRISETTLDPMNSAVCIMSTSAVAQWPGGNSFIAAWETSGDVRFGSFDFGKSLHQSIHDVPGDAGNRKHPAVAVDAKGNLLIAWAVGTGWHKGGAVEWEMFDPSLKPIPSASGHVDGLPVWSMPAVFADHRGGFVLLY